MAKTELKQIALYLFMLTELGTLAGTKYVQKLDGPIWELTPGYNRILIFAWIGKRFVLLHQFRKKTQKTPLWEIDQAKREYVDWLQRNS
jgi:phage-related protein